MIRNFTANCHVIQFNNLFFHFNLQCVVKPSTQNCGANPILNVTGITIVEIKLKKRPDLGPFHVIYCLSNKSSRLTLLGSTVPLQSGKFVHP